MHAAFQWHRLHVCSCCEHALGRRSNCILADVKELWVKVQGTKSEKEQKLVDLVQEPDFGTMFPCVRLRS